MELISSQKYIKNTSTGFTRQRQAGREGRHVVHVSPQLGYLPDTGGGPLTTGRCQKSQQPGKMSGEQREEGKWRPARASTPEGQLWEQSGSHTQRGPFVSGGSAEGRRHPQGLEGRTGSSLPLIHLAQGAT